MIGVQHAQARWFLAACRASSAMTGREIRDSSDTCRRSADPTLAEHRVQAGSRRRPRGRDSRAPPACAAASARCSSAGRDGGDVSLRVRLLVVERHELENVQDAFRRYYRMFICANSFQQRELNIDLRRHARQHISLDLLASSQWQFGRRSKVMTGKTLMVRGFGSKLVRRGVLALATPGLVAGALALSAVPALAGGKFVSPFQRLRHHGPARRCSTSAAWPIGSISMTV